MNNIRKNLGRSSVVFAMLAAALTAQALPPSISYILATRVTENSASISLLDVNPHGLATTYYVEYGPTTSFGLRSAGASFTATTGSQQIVTIMGLDPGTKYSFRAVATNGDGTKTTAAQTFTTPVKVLSHFGEASPDDGENPESLILGKNGSFYGMTYSGVLLGGGYYGTIFRVSTAGVRTTLHSFSSAERTPVGELVQAADGTLYGAATGDPLVNSGIVFKITPTGDYTKLHEFAGGSGGRKPIGSLVFGNDGALYGVTEAGGTNEAGIFYKITTGGAFKVVHRFNASSEGRTFQAGLIKDSAGNFYGTALGGPKNFGTIFKITTTGAVTRLKAFQGGADGQYPYAPLLRGSDGLLYGTVTGGGNFGNGFIFKINGSSGAFVKLHHFASGESIDDTGLMQATDGNFYGTANGGGLYGFLYRLTPTGAFTLLHQFGGTVEGNKDKARLVQAGDGNLYGVHQDEGTALGGTFYRFSPPGVFTVTTKAAGGVGAGKATLKASVDPAGLATSVYFDYGTTTSFGHSTIPQDTGAGNAAVAVSKQATGLPPDKVHYYRAVAVRAGKTAYGPVQRMTTCKVAIQTLHHFSDDDGRFPLAGPTIATDGAIWGTTQEGGYSKGGVVFVREPSGAFFWTDLATGSYPYGKLIQTADTSFYGTTAYGGSSGTGSIFQIDPQGFVSTLFSFNGNNGRNPVGALIENGSQLYGATSGGGGNGNLFKLSKAGSFQELRKLSLADGSHSYAGLAKGSDGNFYGTCYGGGSSGNGTVFKMTAAGVFHVIHNFTLVQGKNPYGSLIRGSDNNFYGTAHDGGTAGLGTLFKITPAGAFTALHSFAGSDGAHPYAGLLEASDGKFYGVAESGGVGTDAQGTVFRISSSGTFELLRTFNGPDGAFPDGQLSQATDGSVIGTTDRGGANDLGTLFEFVPPGP